MPEERFRYGTFFIAVVIVILTGILMGSVYFNLLDVRNLFRQSDFHHVFSWTGTFYIAFATPVFYLLKRKYPKQYTLILNIHIFGNLLAMMLVSIHFAHQVSRPPQAFPDLGTGVVLYAAVIALVGTGFLLRFRQAKKSGWKSIRFVHTAVTLTFYLIIFVHILHGLEYI